MRTTSITRAAVLAVAVTTAPETAWSVSAKDVFADVAASVVVVLALDEGGEITAQGSGVVVGAYEVVTNCHVLGDAAGLAVRQAADWSGAQSYRMTASLLKRNEDRDLCLLFVEELPVPPAAKVVRFGVAKTLSVGEEVYAVGAPAGLELSLSRGVVSQLRGTFGKRSAPMVQTDAAISPGSSGGGLFNQAGELVGITSFKRQGENLNFAIPAEWVEELKAQGRPELTKVTARITCLTNPTFDCVIDLALAAALSTDYPFRRSEGLHEIAAMQADFGDLRGARHTLRSAVSEATHECYALCSKQLAKIAIAQTNIGDEEAARQTLFALRTDAGYLAAALAQSGQVSKALEVVSSIDEGDRDRSRALAEIAHAQAEAGDVPTAMATALSIDEDYLRDSALVAVADMQAKAGDFTDAMKTVASIDDATGRSLGSFRIVGWQLASGDVHGAEQTVASVSSTGKDDELFLLYSGIVQAKKGNFTVALAVAESYDARDQNGSSLRVALLNEIAVLQASAGDALGAKQTLESAIAAARGRVTREVERYW